MKLIDKDALVTEIKKLMGNPELIEDWRYRVKMEEKNELLKSIINTIDTLEVTEVDLENYNKVKKALSLSFMKFLDDNRQENKMCLSNGECFDIDKAFDELDFAKLFRYMEKYLKAQKGEV